MGGTGYHSSIAVHSEYDGARAQVFHSLLRSNPGTSFSEAAEAEYTGDVLLVNDIIDGPIGVNLEYGGTASLYGNDVFHSGATCLVSSGTCVTTATAVNACGFTGCNGAGSNFSADPLLQGTGATTVLGATSPCIDAGVNPATYGARVPSDFQNQARPAGAKYDVGHDEVVP